MTALPKWGGYLPSEEALLNNVFCSNCKLTSIVDYATVSDAHGIVLKGKCAKCCGAATRYLED